MGSLIRDKMKNADEDASNSEVAAVSEDVKETTSDAVSEEVQSDAVAEDVKSSTEVAE